MLKFKARISIGKFCAQTGILLLMPLLLVYMTNAIGGEAHSTGPLQVGIAVVAVMLIAIIVRNGPIGINPFVLMAGLLCGVMLCVCVACNELSLYLCLPYMLKFFLWLLVYIIGYLAVKRFSCEKYMVTVMCFAYLVMIGIFFSSLYADYSIKNKNYVITAVYYILCCMPFLFEVKNHRTRNVFLAILAVGVIMSFKRSALLVFACVILVLAISNLKKAQRKRVVNVLIVGCILFIAGVICLTTVAQNNTTLSNILGIWTRRFWEGNSRNTIQREVIRMFFDSNVINIVFGHGYDAVLQESIFNLSAHNDYLEILYDYGIVGFLLYAGIIVNLLKVAKSIGGDNSDRRNGYITSLTIFLVASIPSHMLTYSTYFLIISLYWGFAHGLAAKEQLCIKEDIKCA